MRIGNIDLGNRPVLLAPMEDVTDPSFRLICREQGADMVYTEFVSADALIRNIDSTTRKLNINPAERPAAIQIYGRDIDSMVEAARIAEAANPDVLDINFGCPVKKVASKGAADWTLIGEVKNNPRITIPIIGNGDITTPQALVEHYDRYGVDGIMVGRASIGAPWIFREMKHFMQHGTLPTITVAEKMALLRRQIRESIDRIDEYRGILHIRRHLAATPLFKGIPNFRETRIAMLRAETQAELNSILDLIEEKYLQQ